jgi:S1-C subfamily serine protease
MKAAKPEQKAPPDKFFWTWTIGGALIVLLLILNIFTLVSLSENVQRLTEAQHASQAFLASQIALANQSQSQALSELRDETTAQQAAIRSDLRDQQAAQARIAMELQTELSTLKARSDTLEEQLVSINLKSQDFSLIVDDALQGVASVITDRGIGSGVSVADGYLLTNYHVIAGARQIAIRTSDGRYWQARLAATDSTGDLALLEVDPDALEPLDFAPSRDVRVGSRVIALGSPAGLEFTVTEGIISATDRVDSGVEYFQVDVPINPGNSGGPLVDIQGRIVGIATFKASGFESLGFAVQGDYADDFVTVALAQIATQN